MEIEENKKKESKSIEGLAYTIVYGLGYSTKIFGIYALFGEMLDQVINNNPPNLFNIGIGILSYAIGSTVIKSLDYNLKKELSDKIEKK